MTGNDEWGWDMGSKERIQLLEDIGRGRNEDVQMDVWCCKDGQNGVLSWMCGVAKMGRMGC